MKFFENHANIPIFEFLSKHFFALHMMYCFSIETSGSIGRAGGDIVAAVAIDHTGDAAEEASKGRICGLVVAV